MGNDAEISDPPNKELKRGNRSKVGWITTGSETQPN
jgi:hypothetical protein